MEADRQRKRRLLRRNKDKTVIAAQRHAQREKQRKLVQQVLEFEGVIEKYSKHNQQAGEWGESETQLFKGQHGLRASSGTEIARVQHPVVLGYELRPIETKWDPTLFSPVFFGAQFQTRAELWGVNLDIKIFGMTKNEFEPEALKSALIEATRERNIGFTLFPSLIECSQAEEMDGDKCRRLARKLQRREQKAEGKSKQLVELLRLQRHLLETKGAINVNVHIKVSGLAELCQRKGLRAPYHVGSGLNTMTTCPYLAPIMDLSFGMDKIDRRLGENLAGIFRRCFDDGGLGAALKKHMPKSSGDISVALIETPETIGDRALFDYAVPNDSPRARASEARKRNFSIAESIQNARLHRENRRDDADGTEPRYELAKYLHPCFFRRGMKHVLPSPEQVSPVFWGQSYRELVKDEEYQVDAFQTLVAHPACARRVLIPEDRILYPEPITDRIAKMDPRLRSPVFFGMRQSDGDADIDHEAEMLKAKKSPEPEELEALLDDQDEVCLLVKFKAKAMQKPEDKAARTVANEHDVDDPLMRNPAAFTYKSTHPIFGSATLRMHPASFGYEEEILPEQHLNEVVHPAALGFFFATESLAQVRNSSQVVHPIFFNYTLTRGPKYQPSSSNPGQVRREAALAKLVFDPKRKNVKLCHICFGKSMDGCPMCWRPDIDALDDEKVAEKSKGAIQGILDDPLLNIAATKAKTRRNAHEDGDENGNAITEKGYDHRRATMKLHLVKLAANAMRAHTRFTSWKEINLYRTCQAQFIVLYIKPLPSGTVVRVKIEANKPVSYLYFMYRSNAPSPASTSKRIWLLIPTSDGIICLDETTKLQDDFHLRYTPGLRTFQDYGLGTDPDNRGPHEVCVFHVSDLEKPDIGKTIEIYIRQNLNLVKSISNRERARDPFGNIVPSAIPEENPSMEEATATNRRLNRFGHGQANITSVSIKTRVDSFKGKAEKIAQLTKQSPMGSNNLLSNLEVAISSLNFQLVDTLDKLPRNIPSDRLQCLLVEDMKDILVLQEQQWRASVQERKQEVAKAREEKFRMAIDRRRQSASLRRENAIKSENAANGLQRAKVPPLKTLKS